MSKLTAFLAAVAVMLATTSGIFWQRLGEQREYMRELQAQLHRQEMERPALNPEQARDADGPTIALLPRDPGEAAAEPDRAGKPAEARGSKQTRPVGKPFSPRLTDDPEYRAHKLSERRRQFERWPFRELPRLLRLTPEESNRLVDLLAEQALRRELSREDDVGSVDELTPEEQRDFWAREQERERADRKELAALLGDSKFKLYEDFVATMPSRHEVQELQQALFGSPAALRDDQIEPLVNALARIRKEFRVERELLRAREPRPSEPTLAERVRAEEEAMPSYLRMRDRMIEAAAAYLSTQQLEKFKEQIEERVAITEMDLRQMRAELEREQGRAVNQALQ